MAKFGVLTFNETVKDAISGTGFNDGTTIHPYEEGYILECQPYPDSELWMIPGGALNLPAFSPMFEYLFANCELAIYEQ